MPLRKAIAEADQLVEQNKDWVKNEFESKLKRARRRTRETKVRDAEETMARRVAEFQSRQQKQTEEADKVYPAKLEEIRRRHDEGLKKAEDHYPPRIAALKEKYEKDRRELDESYQQTKATTQEQYKQTWDNLIKDWTEGMARVSGVVGEVRDEAERRFLDWPGRSSTAGSPRPRSRPACVSAPSTSISTSFPSGVAARSAAQIGADPVRAAGPLALSHSGLDADQGGRLRQGRGDPRCSSR